MKFSRLRLSGFKSFVEPTELTIADGLTGIVGPNGCGKSNLLEALRWVMGETSYKSMRASGMDDVIFSGTASRPSRNMAEVVVSLDNSDRSAPAAHNDADELEISRRIEREAGSAYRINGREVRARDVQLLFADASTGARSAALVKQGQIGEIINAKPQARRRILEEAAGITGLHTRRHEAELKLKAAETNLERLDDVIAQLEGQLASLKRQARQAVRYRELSAQIRTAEASGLYRAWQDACDQRQAAGEEHAAVASRLAAATAEVAARTTALAAIGERLPKLREAETVRAAVLQRLAVERDGLEKERDQALARRRELEARIEQATADISREAEIESDGAAVNARLDEEEKALRDGLASDGESRAEAARALQEAADRLRRSQEAADAAAAELSRARAHRDSLTRARDQAAARIAALEQERAETLARRREAEAVADGDERTRRRAEDLAAAVAAAEAAEATAVELEAALAAAREAETAARRRSDEAREAAGRLTTEIRTLIKVLDIADGDLWRPLIDQIKVKAGYESALAAALGDELEAPDDTNAPLHWRDLGQLADSRPLPDGVECLANLVDAPPALARRLAHTGVVDADRGQALQARLHPGQRLVSRAGDVWRWDGFTASADAPSAAAKRLGERNRLEQLQAEREAADRVAAEARAALEAARARTVELGEREQAARAAWREANRRAGEAREAMAAHERELSARLQEISALGEAARRIEEALIAAGAERDHSQAEIDGLADDGELVERIAALRQGVEADRQIYAEALSRHDGLEREARLRTDRLAAIEAERAQWRARAERAEAHVKALTGRRDEAAAELARLADLPARFDARRDKLIDRLSAAESERRQAADALAEAETAEREAAAALKQAEAAAQDLRETRARLGAQLEAAAERADEIARRIGERFGCAADEVAEKCNLDVANLPAKEDIDAQLQKLRDQRERLGAVNLRAEQEAGEIAEQLATMTGERDDLVEAIHKLRIGISVLNREGRKRLLEAFEKVNANFADLFKTLFGGGDAELQLIESDDPLEAGLELVANPPGKRPQVLSLLSGGEQALTALALIFAVFLTNPSPICVLDEVDAPLDDHNIERFCNLLDAICARADTRFLVITHHPITMARMNRLYGVTMMERGVSQLVSVDLETAEGLRQVS